MDLSNYRILVSNGTTTISVVGYCEECEMQCFDDEPFYGNDGKVWHTRCFRLFIKRRIIGRNKERARW